LRYFFVILVIAGVLIQNISKTFIVLNFQINREYVAKNLCEKKEVENNCCQGSCHLKKELKKEEKKEQVPGASLLKDKSETQLFFQTINVLNIYNSISELTKCTHYEKSKPASVSFSIFHPPRV
jgi:hypothetical protein